MFYESIYFAHLSSLIIERLEKLESIAVIDILILTAWYNIKHLIFVHALRLLLFVFHHYFVTKTIRFTMLGRRKNWRFAATNYHLVLILLRKFTIVLFDEI